ncbi:MAG: DegV family protein [Chloroflexi bacterium]|nr:DegV family protein [Chloroflexota bacterium]
MVKIVTDSTSDLPPEIAGALGITVVPAYVHFGDKSYRDGVDLDTDDLYRRMLAGPVHPTTSAPAPGDFAEVYRRLARETDEIVAVTVTSKQSAVYDSALMGKESLKERCRIEVVDSQSVTMGLGLMAIMAARKAEAGAGMDEVLEALRQAIPRTHGLAVLETLKYALKGGRLGKAGALIGALVKVRPMLTIRAGVIGPSGVTRTHARGVERLCDFVRKHRPIDDTAVVHSSSPEEAQSLAEQLRSIVPQSRPIVARLGAALGVHAGPGALVVVVREGTGAADRAVEGQKRGRRLALPPLRMPHKGGASIPAEAAAGL